MTKAFFLSWLTILALAVLLNFGTYHAYPFPTPHTSSRIAAAIFLISVILLGIVEFGWGGGDPNKRS